MYLLQTRSLTAIREEAGLSYGLFIRKGEVFAYVKSIHNLKYLNIGTVSHAPQDPKTTLNRPIMATVVPSD